MIFLKTGVDLFSCNLRVRVRPTHSTLFVVYRVRGSRPYVVLVELLLQIT